MREGGMPKCASAARSSSFCTKFTICLRLNNLAAAILIIQRVSSAFGEGEANEKPRPVSALMQTVGCPAASIVQHSRL